MLGSGAFFSLSVERKFALLVSALGRAFISEFLRAAEQRGGGSQVWVKRLPLHSRGV